MKIAFYGSPFVSDENENGTEDPISTEIIAHQHNVDFLAGLIRCRSCDGILAQAIEKREGYYLCKNTKDMKCGNKIVLSREKIEAIILNSLREEFLNVEKHKEVYQRAENCVAEVLDVVPEKLRQKRKEFEKKELELQKMLNLLKPGSFDKREPRERLKSDAFYVTRASIQTLALIIE